MLGSDASNGLPLPSVICHLLPPLLPLPPHAPPANAPLTLQREVIELLELKRNVQAKQVGCWKGA